MKKFTQINESKTEYEYVCLLVGNNKETISSVVFKTESDMNYWILNMVNDELSKFTNEPPYDYETHWKDRIYFINNKYIIVDAFQAIIWMQNYKDVLVYNEKSEILKTVKDKYDTDIIRKSKKYNII